MEDNRRYLIKNILKGLLWLALFLGAYLFVKRHLKIDFLELLGPISDNDFLIYTIFLLSEIVIGIIPPELFMIWAAERNDLLINYIFVVFVLSVVSYCAGILGYVVGRYLSRTRFYRYVRKRFLRRTSEHFVTFGPLLIIVAALTPVPFSGVAMITGAVRFSSRKYLLFSLTRFLRFLIYGIVFWEARHFV